MLLFILVILYVSGLTLFVLDKIIIKGQWGYVIFFMCLYLPLYIAILSIVYQATGSVVMVGVFQYLKELVLVLALASFIFYQRDPFGFAIRLNIIDNLFIAFLLLATLYLFLPLGDASFINKLLYLKNTFLMGVF